MNEQLYPVTISLVTWNGARWLPFCLEAIRRLNNQKFMLMVIDNASIDGSADLVEKYLSAHPELRLHSRLVRNRLNVGFARAHNQSLAWTKSEFVLILNQDVLLTHSYLSELTQCLAHDERAAAATGKLLQWSFDPASFYLGEESQNDQVMDSCGLQVTRSRRVVNIAQGESDNSSSKLPQRVFGVSATAALYRRSAFERVSPRAEVFDEDFVSYKEDVDLAWRLIRGGFDSWYIPQAIAYHDRSLIGSGTTFAELKQRRLRHREHKVYSYSNHLAMFVKHETWANFLLDSPWIIGHEIAKAAYLLITDPATLALGLARTFRLTPVMIKKRSQLKPTRVLSVAQLRQWWSKSKTKDS